MSIKIFYLLVLSLLLLSCNQSKPPALAPEYLYNQSNLKVISSLINRKKATIAIIYGNEPALRTARDNIKKRIGGERYVMVTWKQRPMPHWYGTNMNGPILSVETVTVSRGDSGEIQYNYQLKAGGEAQLTNKKNRIRLITGQAAAVFPDR